jgi:transcriptional regulator GlxA family with amidase domain
MKHLTILVPAGQNNLSSIVGTFKIFSRANEFWKQVKGQERFRIELAGLSRRVDFHDGLFTAKPHKLISEIRKTHLMIIPSLNHNFHESVRKNTQMVDWIATQYKGGAEVASICTGAFLLAETGLLNGKSCSTHWSAANAFRIIHPEVKLKPDRLITDEDGICTNGGAYSFLNLIIYLIEKFYDRQTAVLCSKIFQIDVERQDQSAFSIFTGQKSHGDETIQKAQLYLEKNIAKKVTVGDLSTLFAVSRRNFDRRFIRATGNTPVEYSQRVKIELAKNRFESSSKTISEVMYEVGYSDVKAFREVFRKFTGLSPMDYRDRYNKRSIPA